MMPDVGLGSVGHGLQSRHLTNGREVHVGLFGNRTHHGQLTLDERLVQQHGIVSHDGELHVRVEYRALVVGLHRRLFAHVLAGCQIGQRIIGGGVQLLTEGVVAKRAVWSVALQHIAVGPRVGAEGFEERLQHVDELALLGRRGNQLARQHGLRQLVDGRNQLAVGNHVLALFLEDDVHHHRLGLAGRQVAERLGYLAAVGLLSDVYQHDVVAPLHRVSHPLDGEIDVGHLELAEGAADGVEEREIDEQHGPESGDNPCQHNHDDMVVMEYLVDILLYLPLYVTKQFHLFSQSASGLLIVFGPSSARALP